jgi:hypothetical protein
MSFLATALRCKTNRAELSAIVLRYFLRQSRLHLTQLELSPAKGLQARSVTQHGYRDPSEHRLHQLYPDFD